MIASPQQDIKPAAAVIADDVICQSFIQSSSTLAYACLLIRRRRFELAAHVLHSLESKQASRFKDMVFYLQAQIGIETGEYAMVKKRLVPRAEQHPNDMVALSLLECCVWRELEVREERGPAAPSAGPLPTDGPPSGQARPAAAAPSATAPAAPEPPTASATAAAGPAGTALPPSAPAGKWVAPVPGPGAAATAGGADLGPYQGLAEDGNTLALGLWNDRGRGGTFCRSAETEPVIGALARALPGTVQAACDALESGPVHKICFSFQHLTATTFHAGRESMALLTGPLNQSLLALVRAENTFKKSAGAAA